jgi:uncharacterized protein (DUF305 family)
MRALLVAAVLAALPAAAFGQHGDHAAATSDPASAAYAAANEDMMGAMMEPPSSGDPDKDFALMMIPHHEGAIAMAKVVLEYGDDPEIRELAEAIVAAQQSEVDWLKAWLARQPQ